MQETGKIEQQERIYIIQPIFDDTYPVWEKETISLIESAGASHAGTTRQKIREVNPATVIGPGKLAELSARLEGLDVTVLYNGDLWVDEAGNKMQKGVTMIQVALEGDYGALTVTDIQSDKL